MHSMTRFGAVDAPGVAGSITVAADAAVNPTRNMYGAAFLATNGMYGLLLRGWDRRDGEDMVTVCELRAVSYALERLSKQDAPIEVLTDSDDALGFLRGWQRGVEVYPRSYDTGTREADPARLVVLSGLIMRDPDRYTFTWVRGHEGHELNEFADSAAKLAMRVGTHHVPRNDAKVLPRRWATARLGDWLARRGRASAVE